MLQNQNEQNNVNNLSDGLAERFIVFLKNIFSEEREKFSKEKVIVMSNQTDETTGKLHQALNKNGGIEERSRDFDIEEELTSKWQTHAKEIHSHLPLNNVRQFDRSWLGGKKIKFLPTPSLAMFLPSGKSFAGSKSSYAANKTPLAVRMATLIAIAFITSIFIGVAQPQLAVKIAERSDSIFNFPINNFFALAGLDEYQINTDFYKNLSRILAENKKIKSNFIRKNIDQLETAENSRKNFLITEKELLGLTAKAATDNQNGEIVIYSWREKFDILIWEISRVAENNFNFISRSFGVNK